MTDPAWAPGDSSGLDIPAHIEALRSGGVAFLTDAFRSGGALAADNRVTRITQFEECFGGGTGRKLFLAVEYETPQAGVPTDLFVKFSRDFDDARRDRQKYMMESEVRLALLSRAQGFPIAVAKCLFADFHQASGTAILITARIAYGSGGIERHYAKCLDHELPAPLDHYRALVKALARLAGTHKAGRLPDGVARQFPFDREQAIASDRIRYSADALRERVAKLAEFIARHKRLFPVNIVAPEFFADLAEEAPRFLEHETAIREYLFGNPDFIALCHWNANIDNAWFWRDARGELEAGLLDWGRVGQMNVAQGLYGALSGAEPQLWNDHLNELLALFAAEFEGCGGPSLAVEDLKRHVQFTTATMGLAYIMDAPAIIAVKMPDVGEAQSGLDARFVANEDGRVWLHMMTMFLNQWQTQDFAAVLNRFIAHPRA
jgi:hypothetical protein